MVVQPGQAVAHHARLQVPGAGGAVAHGGDQVARANRFGQEVITAFAHGIQLLVQVVFGRQVDDRHAHITVAVADHLGQLRAGAGRHVQVEDDQVGLEVGQLGHGADRVGQAAGEHAGAGQYTLGVHGLCARIVDDQHAQRVVRGGVGQ
ncbi:hypothetical protein D3C71_1791360 [compost metagenome]